MGEERYNQKVMQNAYRRSVYADVFRGSPFEKMFLGEQEQPPKELIPMVLEKDPSEERESRERETPLEAVSAINRNPNAKIKVKPIGIYDANKEPVITQYSSKNDPNSGIIWKFPTAPQVNTVRRTSDIDHTPGTVLETAKEFWEDSKETAKNFWETTKKIAKNVVNEVSSWANEKGFFDDATNAFFLTSDISQNSPIKLIPTNRLHKKIADENYKANQKIDLSGYEANGGYINDQNAPGSQASKIRYGNGTLKDNGCEIIAVNNALVSLGNRTDVRDIAKYFETNGQAVFGAFGTSPFAVGHYFKKQGYEVKTFTGDKKIYNLDIPDADTYIVSFWNSDKITSAIHTVSVDKLPNGKYKIYNENGRKALKVGSLNEYLLESNRVPLVLYCIKKG